MAATEEEKKHLMDEVEPTATKSSPKKDGTRVFKKTSPNGKITVYVGKRDFVDHVTEVDPIDGVVLVDSDYFNRESKKDRKVFVQVLIGFRYGRDDLDVLGLNNFRRDLVDERLQVFPPPDPTKPQLLTLLQVRLLKKLGRNAYPFTFSLKKGLPSSIALQAPHQGEVEKPCGVDFILRGYVAKNVDDRIEKRNSVRLSIKKITHAPLERAERPVVEVSKEFMLSSHPLTVEANLDKGTYYHGEPVKVNVSITNRSNKTVRKIKVSVRQVATICLFANAEYKCTVAELESSEGFPIAPGGSLQRTYEVVPLLKDNRDKKGLALDGQIKHEDTCLASSTILPDGVTESKEVKENLGITVHYNIKIRCNVAFGSDLTAELPLILTHPKPRERVISQMITLPPRSTLSSTGDATKPPAGEGDKKEDEEARDEEPAAATAGDLSVSPQPSVAASVHDIIDHNLISFDTSEADDDHDFVFEEFVRLRVAGVDEGPTNETDA